MTATVPVSQHWAISLTALAMALSFNRAVDSIEALDGKLLIGLSALEGNIWDGELRILDGGGEDVARTACDCGIAMARFARDGKLVLAARDDGDVYAYNAFDLSFVQKIECHDDIVTAIAVDKFSAASFASCSYDGSVSIFDMHHTKEGQTNTVYCVKGAHVGSVNEVSYNPSNSSLFCSVGQDGFLRTWDVRSKSSSECVAVFDLGLAGSSCVWSDIDGDNMIASGTDAGDIVWIDIRVNKVIAGGAVHGGRVRRICASRSHPGTVISCGDDCTINVSSTSDTSVLSVVQRIQLHGDYVADISVDWTGATAADIFSCSTDKTVQRSSYCYK